MKVTVTATDLHHAESHPVSKSEVTCPIVQALKRKYNVPFVTAYGDRVTVLMDDKRVRYRPSKQARAFMAAFDSRETVQVPVTLTFRHIPAKDKR